jgi:hypothetical protein
MQMLSGGTDHSAINLAHSSCCKYLSHVWVHHDTIEGIQETFSSDLWTKVVSGSDVVSGSEEGKNLVSKMLLTSDEAVLSKLTQVLLSNTVSILTLICFYTFVLSECYRRVSQVGFT